MRRAARWRCDLPVVVVVPYTNLHPKVLDALRRDHLIPILVDTTGPEAYWECLRDAWDRGETFIILEHDKVPAPGLLRELWDCPMPWCTVATPTQDGGAPAAYPTLACTKFDRKLIAKRPQLMDAVGRLDLGLGEKEWSRLDLAIAGLLTEVIHCHYHEGVVEHLHQDAVAE